MNRYRQYRAPDEHGESLIDPKLSDVGRLILSNGDVFRGHGEWWDSLRRRAREVMLSDALRYTSSYRDTSWVDQHHPGPIVMAGHQPSIFHAGVWFKNFALDRIARQTGGIAVNLVIDNDVAPGCSVRVPSIRPRDIDAVIDGPHREAVPYDEAGGGVPYEQTTVHRRDIFDSFDKRLCEAVAGIVDDPCVTQLWTHAKSAIERCGVAGCALAQARHGLEGELGLQTLEIPFGVICRTTAFAEFVLAILTELPRFHRCYNDSADQYRLYHGIRSTAHPVPNLSRDGDWFEAPLWIYGNDSPERKAAWVRLSDDVLSISDRSGRELRIDIRHSKLAAEQLANLVSPNFKLRPRALVTTMYARLVLSDLFLHGIGGGKYDQLGDEICRGFFAISPPKFMVISATIKLPGWDEADYEKRIRDLTRRLRDIDYQPERFADEATLDESLMKRKTELLSAGLPTLSETGMNAKKDWHDEITRINSQLAMQLEPLRKQTRFELIDAERKNGAQRLMASREHPFCVFPIEYLKTTFQRLLA